MPYDRGMQRLKLLWQGYLPLEVAFWQYAIFYGLMLNIVATVAALFLIAFDVPIAVAVIVHLLPVPYSILTIVGVWRSADRYAGQSRLEPVARIGVLAWSGLWLVI